MLNGIPDFLDASIAFMSYVKRAIDWLISQSGNILALFNTAKTAVTSLLDYIPDALVPIAVCSFAYWIIMLILHGGANNG